MLRFYYFSAKFMQIGMTLKTVDLSKLTQIEAGQRVKTTFKDLQTAGITTTTVVHVSNYINQLLATTIVDEKGLLQFAKDEETDELANLVWVRDWSIAVFRLPSEVAS